MNTAQAMNTAQVDGKTVRVGDDVSFKSDVEQSGTIIHITKQWNGTTLKLEDEDGFSGDYIGGQTITSVMVGECWVD